MPASPALASNPLQTNPDAPRALVVRAAGTNCDAEMVRAFQLAGATAQLIHLDRLIDNPQLISDADLLGFPGGFSYGDDVASGRIFAAKLKAALWPALRDAARKGVPMIAACNGFQILVQSGLLPGPASTNALTWPDHPPAQELALAHNHTPPPGRGGGFTDRWCRVEPDPTSVCIWTKGLLDPLAKLPPLTRRDVCMLPVAHGEGRLVASSPSVIERLRTNGQIALRYAKDENPNGSTDDIAGICDPSGRIFGLMPHPERYLDWTRHPFWTALDSAAKTGDTPGLMMFKNAVNLVKSQIPAGAR